MARGRQCGRLPDKTTEPHAVAFFQSQNGRFVHMHSITNLAARVSRQLWRLQTVPLALDVAAPKRL